MSTLRDELDDIRRRTESLRDTISASHTDTTTALDTISQEVAALRDTDLSTEQTRHVDNIDAQLTEIRRAVDSAGDGYKPRRQEPAPVKGAKGKPAPGSVEDRERGGI